MQYRPLGNSGIEASVVAFGAWAIGGWPWGGTDEEAAVKAIHTALHLGISLIDTAPAYGLGLSEEIIGKALEGRRDEAVIATKCGLVWDTNKGTYFLDEYDKRIHKYLGPESIRNECELSLKRLKTDRIDLYQTHWQDSTVPIEDSMAVLLDLKAQGKIRAIGVSNATVAQMDEYCKYGGIVSDQESYNMLNRRIEAENLPYCLKNSIAVLAYSPMAGGLLTGKVSPDRVFPEDDRRSESPSYSVENRIKVNAMLEKIKPIAEKHGITLAQLVIAWTAAQPGITHVLCGVRNPRQAEENARAGDVSLSTEDINAINRALEA